MKDALATHNIELVMVPKNMTHLLQPLDLTTNASFKKFEKRAFTEYFTSCIMKALEIDPDRDVASIEVDLRLSTLKKGIIGAGWKAAGISENLIDARKNQKNPIKDNPFERFNSVPIGI